MKKSLFFALFFLLVFTFVVPAFSEEPSSDRDLKQVMEKLDKISKKQEDISKQLEALEKELYIVKIRVSSQS